MTRNLQLDRCQCCGRTRTVYYYEMILRQEDVHKVVVREHHVLSQYLCRDCREKLIVDVCIWMAGWLSEGKE
jgi:hypothetical protein